MLKQETALPSALYELLSVLQLLGILAFQEVNVCLTPRATADGYIPKVTEGMHHQLRARLAKLGICVLPKLYKFNVGSMCSNQSKSVCFSVCLKRFFLFLFYDISVTKVLLLIRKHIEVLNFPNLCTKHEFCVK